MRVTLTAKRGLSLAAASLIAMTACAAPAFADEAIIGFDGKTHDVGVAIVSCDNTEVAYKPVLNPTSGAAVELVSPNEKDAQALLSGLQRGDLPSIALSPIISESVVPKAQQRVVFLAGMIGTAEIDHGKGKEVLFTGKRKPFASFASGSTVQRAAATKAFNATKGTLANKLLAGAAALEANGSLGVCAGKSTSAALLVAYRNDSLYNTLQTFTPSVDPKNAFSAGDSTAPSVFASVLVKPESSSSALTELRNRVGSVAAEQKVRVQYNIFVEEAKSDKVMWMSAIGAAVAAAVIAVLIFRQRRMNAASAAARKDKKKPATKATKK